MVAPRFARPPKIRLPVPATHTTRYTRWSRRLRARKLLILAVVIFWITFYKLYWSSSSSSPEVGGGGGFEHHHQQLEALKGVEVYRPRENDMGEPHTELRHLVVVAGHAIWLGGDSKGEKDEEWTLAPFQKGEGPTYVKHIRAGVEAVKKDEKALLVFSGGETEESAGPRSEGGSYFELADALGLIPDDLLPRITTEWHALDSFQNLLFSILRFHEYTSHYPTHITIISHGFKRSRFLELHAKAIGYPLDKIEFVGIDPPVMEDEDGAQKVRKSEERTREEWSRDGYACGSVLREKRKSRGWSRRGDGYWDGAVEVRGLLEFCPEREGEWFEGDLPWRKGE